MTLYVAIRGKLRWIVHMEGMDEGSWVEMGKDLNGDSRVVGGRPKMPENFVIIHRI